MEMVVPVLAILWRRAHGVIRSHPIFLVVIRPVSIACAAASVVDVETRPIRSSTHTPSMLVLDGVELRVSPLALVVFIPPPRWILLRRFTTANVRMKPLSVTTTVVML